MGLSLGEWVTQIFDHPVTDPAWHFKADGGDIPEVSRREAAELVAATFERAGSLLAPFTDAQLNMAFWLLVSPGNSGYLTCIKDRSVEWRLRQRALR
jgi:hypothetical protein